MLDFPQQCIYAWIQAILMPGYESKMPEYKPRPMLSARALLSRSYIIPHHLRIHLTWFYVDGVYVAMPPKKKKKAGQAGKKKKEALADQNKAACNRFLKSYIKYCNEHSVLSCSAILQECRRCMEEDQLMSKVITLKRIPVNAFSCYVLSVYSFVILILRRNILTLTLQPAMLQDMQCLT